MTPLKPSTYIASDMTVNFVLGLIGTVLTVAVAMTIFGVSAPESWLGVVGAVAIGMVAFLAFGYALAAIVPSTGAATGIGNILMIIFMITSGAFVPVQTLSDSVQTVFKMSPSYHLATLVRQTWVGESWSGASIAVLLAMAAACSVLAALLMRRRS